MRISGDRFLPSYGGILVTNAYNHNGYCADGDDAYETLQGLNIRNCLISTLLLYILRELVVHCMSDIRGELPRI